MRVTDLDEFSGRHYETGKIANWLAASGHPISESLALGASGGIAFGYFVFEYKGHIPHVALLTRNTFDPFTVTLDHLGIKRNVMETVKPEIGEENLRRELDMGRPVIVWADAFSAPWKALPQGGMWAMQPLLVIGYDEASYLIVDGSPKPFEVDRGLLLKMRGVVKKDRYRCMTLEGVNEDSRPELLNDAMRNCLKLFLEKPPAGSAKNFGLTGMDEFIRALRDETTAKGWAKLFPAGEKFMQGVAGRIGQPGIYDWIETWGTKHGADRGTYASFLREASAICGLDFEPIAQKFDESARLWQSVAEASLPDSQPPLKKLKAMKREYEELRWNDPLGTITRRLEMRQEMADLRAQFGDDVDTAREIRYAIASAMEAVRTG
ncbi:MAG: BtrH N-terminal domain-containing protein [Fimbriimonadaceae bacterium]